MRELTFFSAHCTRKFLPFNEIPSVPIVSIAFEASSLSANETYPTTSTHFLLAPQMPTSLARDRKRGSASRWMLQRKEG